MWELFEDTDQKPNGKVWDMYSDIPGGTPPYEYNFGFDQCGNYSGEGDCFNKEHSWPSSWSNDEYPMKSDLFHIYPTDGYVNGMRSNLPFGEVGSANWTSLNGSKRGYSSYSGYSEIVFEPIDEYKGDFARTYFYMCTRYYNEDSGWIENDMVNGAELKSWALEMLFEWHFADPVSEKEIERNDAVYEIQNNRNPFIDHPEFAYWIWRGIFLGDVDIDEEITSYDAALTLQYSAGIISDWSDWQIVQADVNSDENISSYDAALILQYSAGIIDEFANKKE